MKCNKRIVIHAALLLSAWGCREGRAPVVQSGDVIRPAVITEKVAFDADDPAVWINPSDPSESLILGTDKNADGALYVFDLQGHILEDKTIKALRRPNNVDVEYGLQLGGAAVDIAVVTERLAHKLRVFSLPDMQPVDNGGIEVFVGEKGREFRSPMGVGLYRNPRGEIFAIVGRKNGPTDGTYLAQYRLEDDGSGKVQATLVRKFGNYSGKNEIESIAVDDAMGYVYYSDEGVGVRKYYADAEKGNQELALFATEGFAGDHEGISVYATSPDSGYLLVSDQKANRFQIFSREGSDGNPHNHLLLKTVTVAAKHSDGSETVSVPLNDDFRRGLFIAMSNDKTFHLYKWEDIAGSELAINPIENTFTENTR